MTGYKQGLKLYDGPRGKVYYYKFKFGGEVLEGSTGCQGLREAKAYMEALKTDLREKKKRGEFFRASMPKLSAVYQAWTDEMKTKATPGHLRSVRTYWKRHIEPVLGHLPLNMVSTAMVEACRAKYLEAGGTNGGANSLIIALNALFGWAIRHKKIAVRPYQVAKLRVQRKPRPILAGSLATRFLCEIDKARNPHVRTAIRLMMGLGLREDEALTARWEWLDLHRLTYTPGKTKGREAVVLDLPTWLADYLRPLKQESSGLMLPVVVEPEDGREPYEASHVAGFVKKAVKRAAIALGIPGLTPHRLRATFASLHSDAGTPLPEIQNMLRHKNIATTMRYIESGREHRQEAQRKVAEMMGLQPKKAKGVKKGEKNPKSSIKTCINSI